jgi:hypothetical protein
MTNAARLQLISAGDNADEALKDKQHATDDG